MAVCPFLKYMLALFWKCVPQSTHQRSDKLLFLTTPSVSLSPDLWAPPGTNRVSYTNERFLSSVTKMVWELLPRKGMRELKKRAEPLRSLNLHCSNLHHVNVAPSSLQLASLCFLSALGRLRCFWGHGNFLLPLKTTLWHPGAITLLRID